MRPTSGVDAAVFLCHGRVMAHSSLTYLRCPVCGKVSRGPSFGMGAKGEHTLVARVQSFIGGHHEGKGHGFAWTTREIRPEELETLLLVVDRVQARLQAEVRALVVADAAGVLVALLPDSFRLGLGENHDKVDCHEERYEVHAKQVRFRAA